MLKSKKIQKERSARDDESLHESFPCSATERKMDLAAFLEGENGRLAGLWSQE